MKDGDTHRPSPQPTASPACDAQMTAQSGMPVCRFHTAADKPSPSMSNMISAAGMWMRPSTPNPKALARLSRRKPDETDHRKRKTERMSQRGCWAKNGGAGMVPRRLKGVARVRRARATEVASVDGGIRGRRGVREQAQARRPAGACSATSAWDKCLELDFVEERERGERGPERGCSGHWQARAE